ncbi:hypothetical protein ACFLQ1_00510 [Candidatus Auribacterota bacterium]
MKVYEDGQVVDLELSSEDTLEKAIVVLDERANKNNRIVAEIKVDNILMDSENEKEFNAKLVKDTKKIELKVEEEIKIINRALNEAYQYLPKLSNGLEDISLLLQAGSRNEAYDKFSDCLNGWIQIINLLQSIEKIKEISYEKIDLKEGTIKDVNIRLLELLEETKEAMQNDDTVSLSDLIEYELSPMAKKQIEVVQKIIDVLKED